MVDQSTYDAVDALYPEIDSKGRGCHNHEQVKQLIEKLQIKQRGTSNLRLKKGMRLEKVCYPRGASSMCVQRV